MSFILIALLMVVLAVLALASPLLWSAAFKPAPLLNARGAIYRDQLSELKRDRDNGRIDGATYEAARAEVARRLLAAEKEAKSGDVSDEPERAGSRRRAWLPVGVISAVLICSAFFYSALGSPATRDQPLASRINAEQPDLAVLIAQVERHLAEVPDDGRGWDLLAPIYARQQRFEDAQNAYANAIRLLGPDVGRLNGLGEAMVSEASGVVTDNALAVFRQAIDLSNGDATAGYYVALAAEQAGDHAAALAGFRALRANAPDGAPWVSLLDRHIASNLGMIDQQGIVRSGPDQSAVDAAQDLSDEQRAEMIEGMVASLEERLAADPDNVEGWMQLIRSYMVLGDDGRARAALQTARGVFADRADEIRQLDGFAGSSGLLGEAP